MNIIRSAAQFAEFQFDFETSSWDVGIIRYLDGRYSWRGPGQFLPYGSTFIGCGLLYLRNELNEWEEIEIVGIKNRSLTMANEMASDDLAEWHFGQVGLNYDAVTGRPVTVQFIHCPRDLRI